MLGLSFMFIHFQQSTSFPAPKHIDNKYMIWIYYEAKLKFKSIIEFYHSDPLCIKLNNHV